MGKKKGKPKSKPSAAKPKDDRTLPFLQDMFPNVEKDIVGIIFEQNEYDEEKSIQQLEELSLNDGTKPAPLYDDSDEWESVEEEDPGPSISSTTYSSQPSYSITAPIEKANKRQTPPKLSPFISTHDDYHSTPYSTPEKAPINKRQTPPKLAPFMSTHDELSLLYNSTYSNPNSNSNSTILPFSLSKPPSATASSSSSTTPSSTSTKKYSQAQSYESGDKSDSKHFLASMFPELDSTMVALLYDENGNDVGKTVESLLSIVFMNHSGGSGEVEDEEEPAGEGEGEFEEAFEDGEGEYDDVDTENMGDFKIEIPRSTAATDNSAATKSDFIVKLNLLAELFPDTPRTLLALELDELDCDLEKTIASCCRADPEYLRRLSGEKATVISTKEEKPKGPAAVDSVLKPSWVGSGNSHAHLVKDALKVKYVKPTPSTPAARTKSSAKGKEKATSQTAGSPRRRGMDLAAKLKLKQLREKFSFVDHDILEAVFVQSGYKVQATLICLYDIYPHLREHTAAPEKTSFADKLNISPPGSPELPLSRKREKPDVTATTTPAHPNGEKPRKPKRTKPEEAGDDDEGEFVTVSYRKKKAEPGANGSTPNKKVMDSDDIENAYQNYREQAIKNGEMRNLMFMQAAAAYQTGDGARAKALSQRGRDYDEMMKESHRQACHQIFLDCNARHDTLASIDLHGLHVAEALQVISQLLEIHAQMGENNNNILRTKKLRIITGQGRHSLHGIAKIKPAVKNFLRSKGHTFAEVDAGVITVSLSKI